MTLSMMENGLFEFSTSIFKFHLNREIYLRFSQFDDDSDLQPLKMPQFIRPMILIYGLLSVTTLVLIGEIIVQKWNSRHIRKRYSFILLGIRWNSEILSSILFFRKSGTNFTSNEIRSSTYEYYRSLDPTN